METQQQKTEPVLAPWQKRGKARVEASIAKMEAYTFRKNAKKWAGLYSTHGNTLGYRSANGSYNDTFAQEVTEWRESVKEK